MTIEDFFNNLRKTPRDWYLHDGYKIRRNDNRYCPWLQVGKEKNINLCNEEEGLGDTCWAIALAADNAPGHDAVLRAQLLEACGLAEPTV
jgi:hypothetical protein